MQDDPLIVPGDQPTRLRERGLGAHPGIRQAHFVHGPVVREQHRGLQAGDHDVLVVPRVGDDGAAIRLAGQVLEDAAALDTELGAVRLLVELR